MMLDLAETKVCHALYACGGITKNTIRRLGGDEDTIISLMEKKMVKKDKFEIDGKPIAVYRFTRVGEKEYTELFNKNRFYRCENLRKAIELGYFYSSLSDEDKDTWVSKDEFSEEDGANSARPDATFTKQGIKCGIFVLKESDGNIKLDEFKKYAMTHKLRIVLKKI